MSRGGELEQALAYAIGFGAVELRRVNTEVTDSALRTARDVRERRGAVAVYTNPLSPNDVFDVTAAGEVLPQKSTFFFPKLPTGLVFRLFEDD